MFGPSFLDCNELLKSCPITTKIVLFLIVLGILGVDILSERNPSLFIVMESTWLLFIAFWIGFDLTNRVIMKFCCSCTVNLSQSICKLRTVATTKNNYLI